MISTPMSPVIRSAVAALPGYVPGARTTSPLAAALASLAAQEQMRDRVVQVVAERRRLVQAARSLGYALPDGDANFVWLRTAPAVHEALLAGFAAAEVLVRPFAGPGDPGIRVTVADPATGDRVLGVLDEVSALRAATP